MNSTCPLKILIDDGLTSRGNRTGIGYHSANIAAHLAQLTRCDLSRFPAVEKFPRYFRKWAYIGASNMSGYYRDYDVIHHMSHYVPFNRGKNKHIATIHDLSVMRYPETISLVWRHYNLLALKDAVKRADAIVTLSSAIREELLDTFQSVDESKVFVGLCGIRDAFWEVKPSSSVIEGFNIKPFSYFLYVGDLTKRKNLAFMLETFLEAKKERRIDKSTPLVLIGKRAWGHKEFESLLYRGDGIHVLGYLPEDALVSFYHYAKGLIFPSLYEGFGLPVVEAMSQNIPIIASKIPTNMEFNTLHKGQIPLFELGDQPGFMSMLEHVDRDWEQIRADLDYGDLKRYSYENIARIHLEIYQKVNC